MEYDPKFPLCSIFAVLLFVSCDEKPDGFNKNVNIDKCQTSNLHGEYQSIKELKADVYIHISKSSDNQLVFSKSVGDPELVNYLKFEAVNDLAPLIEIDQSIEGFLVLGYKWHSDSVLRGYKKRYDYPIRAGCVEIKTSLGMNIQVTELFQVAESLLKTY